MRMIAATFLASVALAAPAQAAVFSFSFSFAGQYVPGYIDEGFGGGMGTITTSDQRNADGSLTVTGITGLVTLPSTNGFASIERLLPDQSFDAPLFGNPIVADNKFWDRAPKWPEAFGELSFDGIAFKAGDYAFALFAGGHKTTYTPATRWQNLSDGTGGLFFGPGTIAFSTINVPVPPATVPEPSTWALMIGGFALVGGVLRRRRVTVTYA